MRKGRSLLLLAAALLGASVSCRPPAADWQRPGVEDPRAMDDLLHDGSGRPYFHKPGHTLSFASRGRVLRLRASLDGDCCLDLSFWSPASGALRLRARRGGRQEFLSRRFALRRGFNAVSVELRLRRNDRLLLEADVEGIFSQPLLYRLLPASARRNIILISADNLGADHLDLYGYSRSTAPAVAAFRRDAVMFRWAFASSPWTLPSHMSLFTALGEAEHGVTFRVRNEEAVASGAEKPDVEAFPLGLDKEFLVERLSRSFITCGFTGGINVAAAFGFHRGFDMYLEAPNDPFAADSAARLFRRAERHLLRHRFPAAFYFLHTYQVHLPYRPPPDLAQGDGRALPRGEFDFVKDIGGIGGVFRRGDERRPGEAAALYDGEVMEFDRRFGEFIAFLKRNGLYDRALVILLSDHGEEFFEHGSWAHGTDLFNSQVRVPLLVKLPGGRFAGRSHELPVSLADVMPTVLDYYGLALPPTLRGRSLTADLGAAPRSRPVLCANRLCRNWSRLPPQAACIEGGFKLIRHFPAPAAAGFFAVSPPSFPPWQLFRLGDDPHERRDLARELPHVARRLGDLLQGMLAGGVPFPGRSRALPPESLDALRALGYIR